MIEGACHCGTVRWSFHGIPESATACNCNVCHRYGALWAYDYESEGVRVVGPTKGYSWGDRTISFHFCLNCGCVAYWRANALGDDGRRRIAVNLRLAEPEAVASIAVDHLDGLDSWEKLQRNGQCIADMWF